MKRRLPFVNRSEFVITPQMRVDHLEAARKSVRKNFGSYARTYPWSYFKQVLSACGLPLEAIRWINRNDFKPKAWLKRQRDALGARWDQFKVARYTIPMGAYTHGDEAELREFVAGFKEVKGDCQSTWKRNWRGQNYWFTRPGDMIVNKDVTEPKTNGSYLAGATGFRFDDDFFLFAVLPFRYRNLSNETVMAILFPDVPISEYTFIPDSDSPELEAFMENQWLENEAFRMVLDHQPKDRWGRAAADDHMVTRDGDNFTVVLTRDNMVILTETHSRETIKAYIERRR